MEKRLESVTKPLLVIRGREGYVCRVSIGLLNSRWRRILLLGGMVAVATFLWEESAPAVPSNDFSLRSSDYAVEVNSANPIYGGLVLELVNQSFRYFSTRMGIKTFEPMRFRFVLDEEPPAEVSQEMEAKYYSRTVILGDKMEFRVVIPSRDFNPVAVVRTAMMCQLQAYMLIGRLDNPGTQLQAPPFWLMEGLTQGLLDKKTPSLEKVIARIDRQGPVPTLETIQKWDELSPHRMEQWWQEACCYWLVLKATAIPGDRQALCIWLQQPIDHGEKAYFNDDEATGRWWTKVLGEKTREKAPLHEEEETRAELQKCLQFKAVLKGETAARDFNLAELPKPPLEFMSAKPFEEVMGRLLVLQTRGNLLWQEVIEGYRNAYAYWLKGKYADYQREVAKAKSKGESVSEYMTKTRDYLDWYEVNHPASGPQFSTLLRQSLAFQDAKELKERDQAGIAAKLTLIESGK